MRNEQTKSVDTPEWNGNGGTVGRKNDLCSNDAEGMPGLPHNWHSQAMKANTLYGILVVYAKKKRKKKRVSKSPRALAHTHAKEKKKKKSTLSSERFANISVVRKLNKVCFLKLFS